MAPTLAIVGAGILGCTAALLAARRGWHVSVIERAPSAWTGASAHGEGKVHLGLVYALGDSATHRHILDGGLAFSRVLEKAVGAPIPWKKVQSEPFQMVIMPDSLLPVSGLLEQYATLESLLSAEHPGAEYLGAPLERLHDPEMTVDPGTGLPAIRVAERAVHPGRLRAILLAAMEAESRIQLLCGRHVISIDDAEDHVQVRHVAASPGYLDTKTGEPDSPVTLRADAALTCAWESRSVLHDGDSASPLNFRFKTAVTIPATAVDLDRCRTLTMVVGPYGDVVRRRDSVYASWYPAGRIVHEFASAPSRAAQDRVAMLDAKHPSITAQLDALTALGALPTLRAGGRDRVTMAGGWILAEGEQDIDAPDSGLHNRHGDGLARRGRVLTPRNWKFSTAPLAAERAVDAVEVLLSEGVTA